jgi:hypothetical protein
VRRPNINAKLGSFHSQVRSATAVLLDVSIAGFDPRAESILFASRLAAISQNHVFCDWSIRSEQEANIEDADLGWVMEPETGGWETLALAVIEVSRRQSKYWNSISNSFVYNGATVAVKQP